MMRALRMMQRLPRAEQEYVHRATLAMRNLPPRSRRLLLHMTMEARRVAAAIKLRERQAINAARKAKRGRRSPLKR